MIPGLENGRFARLGGLHRNTFINSPKLLDRHSGSRPAPRLRFAGQITGVEGYVESAAIGLMAGRFAATERLDVAMTAPPETTALGALIEHITGGHLVTDSRKQRSFQPMNVNFGLFPVVDAPKTLDGKRLRGKERAAARKRAYTSRALADLDGWLGAKQAAAE